MNRAFKVGIYFGSATLLVAVFLAVALTIFHFWSVSSAETNPPYLDKTVELSDSALLRVHATMPLGASDPTWELLYREKAGWEKVDDWQVEGQISLYSGDVLACPVGRLVVVVRTDGSMVFVRTEAHGWKTFHMEIPQRAPFPTLGMRGTSTATLETSRIQELRSQMTVGPAQASVPARLGQFLPGKRELWVDYLTPADRRFRLRFNLTADGEQLRFLDFQERPFKRAVDTTGPPLFLLLPDTPVPAACNKIEFFPYVKSTTAGQ